MIKQHMFLTLLVLHTVVIAVPDHIQNVVSVIRSQCVLGVFNEVKCYPIGIRSPKTQFNARCKGVKRPIKCDDSK